MTDELNELSALAETMDRLAKADQPIQPSTLVALSHRLKCLEDSLASKTAPARLVIALHDSMPGLDQASATIMGSTVKVTVLVVDHRVEARERIFVLMDDPIDNPSEIGVVVSDDAAEYLQLRPELIELVINNC